MSTPQPGTVRTTADANRLDQVDAIVAAASRAADEFRSLDQEAVDRIVLAMVQAGLRAAGELAGLAIEETGFGVYEDKVIKNYVATEFLWDYLKDKPSVGEIGSDAEAGITYLAEPVGVVLAITPITNPTSTVLFKAIVAAKTRNAVLFRPSPYGVRSAVRTVEILAAAGEAAGLPKGALQVIPDAAHDVTHYLFRHPDVDFIWTTGGPKIVQLTNSAGKPCLSVGPGNAPVYVHRSADITGAVVDTLISKTFDASVICPAEQTCIVDEPVFDEVVAEFDRMGATLLTDAQAAELARFAFGEGDRVNPAALGQSAPELALRAGFTVDPATKVLLALLPSDLGALAEHPLIREKLMPVLGLVRSPDARHGIDAAVLVTEHGGLGHTAAIYATDEAVVAAYAKAVRTGRILVNAPTAVGALGGVYNSLSPTLSLGCGTWGGSNTTDNVNYRNLLNIKTLSRRRVPAQWFRAAAGGIYFNSGALASLSAIETASAVIVTDGPSEQRGLVDEVRRHLATANVRVFAEVTPEPDEAVIRRGVALLGRAQPDLVVAAGGGSVMDAAKVMRLLFEHPDADLAALSLPFLDARKRVADFPQDAHTVRLVAVPTTAGTGSEVSPAAVVTMDGRKVTLVDYTLTPEVAIVDPMLTVDLPPDDHRGHRHRRAHPRARGGGVHLRLAVHGRVLRAGGAADPRLAAGRCRRRTRPRGPHQHAERRDAGRARVLQRLRRPQPRARPLGGRRLRHPARAGQRDLPAPGAALQRVAAVEVHARPRLHLLRRPGQVRAARSRGARRSPRRREPYPPLRRRRRAPGHPRHAPDAEGRRRRRGRVHGAAAAAGARQPSRT